MTNNNTNDYKGLMKEYLGKNGKSVKIGMLTAMAATVLAVGVPSVASADEYVEDTRDGFFGTISTDVLNADPNAEEVEVNTDTVVEYIDEATFNSLEDWQKEHVTWINDHRTENNVKPVELDLALSQQAYMKSVDMAENNYFAHDKDGVGGLKDQNKHFFKGETKENAKDGDNFGENIYWTSHGTDKESNSESSFEGFMNSPGHNANMAFPNYDRVGVGQYKDASGKTHVTQIFYVDDWSTGEVIPVDDKGEEIEEEIEIIVPPVEKEEVEEPTQIPELDDNEDRNGEITEEELESEVEVPEITEDETEEDVEVEPEPEEDADTEDTTEEAEEEAEEEEESKEPSAATPEDTEETESEDTNAGTPTGGTDTEDTEVEETETETEEVEVEDSETETTANTNDGTNAGTPTGGTTPEDVVETVEEGTVLETDSEVVETVEDGGEVVSGAVPTEDGETLETGVVETNTNAGNGNVDDSGVELVEDVSVENNTELTGTEVSQEDTTTETEGTVAEGTVSEEPVTPTESGDTEELVINKVSTEEAEVAETEAVETVEEEKLPDTGIANAPTTAIAGMLMAMGAGLIAFRRKIFGTKEQ